MAHVRSPVLSGSWYPAQPEALGRDVDRYLAAADTNKRPAGRLRVAVVPHAGYTYSGAVAGALYGLLRGEAIARVFLLAPCHHRGRMPHIALSDADAFATPLGEVPLDRSAVARLAQHAPFVVDEGAHRDEHAVEIQLPFLQRSLAPGFQIVPLLVPPLDKTRREEASAALAAERRGGDLVLVSTDFTHYGARYGYVPFQDEVPERLEQLDSGAILRVLRHDADGLVAYGQETGITMCGLAATALAISGAAPTGYEAELVDYARSGDRDGDYSLSVSYASILISSTELTTEEREFLLELARKAVESAVHGRSAPDPVALARERGMELTPALREKRGAFVTLKREGQLRGCIGYIEPISALTDAVVDNARSAAVGDPRFPPVTPAELSGLHLEISALTPLRDVASPEEIVVGRHGILLRKGDARAVFLPQVAVEQEWDRDTTLSHLARKAGLSRDSWRSGAEFAIFEAEILEELPA
jgi:AmmeMemoRadiSam system protein B/AmmeMemoRadiSam system protein A